MICFSFRLTESRKGQLDSFELMSWTAIHTELLLHIRIKLRYFSVPRTCFCLWSTISFPAVKGVSRQNLDRYDLDQPVFFSLFLLLCYINTCIIIQNSNLYENYIYVTLAIQLLDLNCCLFAYLQVSFLATQNFSVVFFQSKVPNIV